MVVDDAFGRCRENLGTYRDLLQSVLVCVSMRVGACLGPCR